MKILSPGLHGAIDYFLVLFLWAGPALFVLPQSTASVVYLLGFAHLLITVCTNSTAGIFRFISLRMHGIIELIISISLIVLCYTELRYDERDRTFVMTFAVMLMVLYLVTDYNGEATATKRVRGSARLRGPKTVA